MSDNTRDPFAYVTSSERLSDLSMKSGQLIFIRDKHIIALDFGEGENLSRLSFGQIIEMESETDRKSLTSPANGLYYFVKDTKVLWTYQDEWIQLSLKPSDLIEIDSAPEIGSENKLYIDSQNGTISVWNGESYTIVASNNANSNDITEATDEDIDDLFTILDTDGNTTNIVKEATDKDIDDLFTTLDTDGDTKTTVKEATDEEIDNLFV